MQNPHKRGYYQKVETLPPILVSNGFKHYACMNPTLAPPFVVTKCYIDLNKHLSECLLCHLHNVVV